MTLLINVDGFCSTCRQCTKTYTHYYGW